MHDLDDGIRAYAEHLEDTTPRVGTETARKVAQTRAPIRSGLANAVAAAALMILVVAVVVILDPFGSEGPFVEEPTTIPTTTSQVTTSTEPAPTTTSEAAALALPAMLWTRVESDAFGGSGDQLIHDIAIGGPGLVAVGSDGSGGDLDAAVWYSTDGRVWTRVPHDELVFGGPGDQYPVAVAAGGPGFVAVGEDGDAYADDMAGIAAVWTSEDGITWSRVPHDEAAFGGEEQVNVFMKDVTAFGSGLVAVGMEWRESDFDWEAVAWTSIDGISWERVPPDEAVFGGPQDQIMWSVVPAGPGLVAVGQAGEGVGAGGPDQPAAVWTSTNGRDWSRVPDQAALRSGFSQQSGAVPEGASGDWARMDDVVIGGPGLVAVGRVGKCTHVCDEDGAAWTSIDGITWQRSLVETVDGVYFAEVYGAAVLGDVLVGVGRGSDNDMELGPAVVWTSNDGGDTWSRVPHSGTTFGKVSEGPNFMFGAVEFGSDLIAVGSWGSNAAVWTATIEE